MREMSLTWIVDATGGEVLSKGADSFTGLGTDTRADLTGQLFVALKGESFDAHDFLTGAATRGAAGLLIHRETPDLQALEGKVTVIKVPDTLRALQAMGRKARRESKAIVIGLTGSNGKTTTKEFTAALIAPFREVHYSKGSFNNHWGVPFSLLQLRPSHDVGVIEMGMNHAGEITELVGIAEPDIVLCTMVGRAHIEYFGSIEKIAEAKEEIYEAAKPKATRIYNLDDPLVFAMYKRGREKFPAARILTFSAKDPHADVRLSLKELTMRHLEVEGTIAGEPGVARVPVFGAQNLTNLMAAAAAGLAAGLEPGEVWQGLAHCRTAWGRNQFVKLGSGAEMIFDAYNANPDSMTALLDNMKLVKGSGRRIGVFGQMKELGAQSPELHEEIGRKAAAAGFDEIFFVGTDQQAFGRGLAAGAYAGPVHLAPDFEPGLGEKLAGGLRAGDMVVVKGSRGMKLERFVEPCAPADFGKKD